MTLRTLALAALLAPTLLAREPGTGRFSGEIRTGDGHHLWDVTVWGAGGKRHGQMSGGGFGMKYDYSTMLREPIVYQVGSYRAGTELVIGRPVDDQLWITGSHVSKPQFATSGSLVFSHKLLVPMAWMEDLRVTGFQPNLRFAHGGAYWTHAKDQNVGILGKSGEWGWDMSGSPDWKDVFQGTHWSHEKDHAKKIWALVADHHEGYAVNASFDPKEIVVDAGPLIERIQRVLPDALGELYPNRLAHQAAVLLRSLERAYREAPGRDLLAGPDAPRLRDGAARFFATFGDKLSSRLRERWRELRDRPGTYTRFLDELRTPRGTGQARLSAARAHRAKHPELAGYAAARKLAEGLKAAGDPTKVREARSRCEELFRKQNACVSERCGSEPFQSIVLYSSKCDSACRDRSRRKRAEAHSRAVSNYRSCLSSASYSCRPSGLDGATSLEECVQKKLDTATDAALRGLR